MKNAFEYEADLAALREELDEKLQTIFRLSGEVQKSNQRTYEAEQRNAELTEAMERIHFRCESFSNDDRGMKTHSVQVMLDIASKALNPTGASK